MLRKYNISLRLQILIVFALLSLLVITATTLTQLRSELLNEKRLKTQSLVETAYSLAEFKHKAFLAGEMSEQQAQQAALAAIESLRYEGSNYFWVNDMTPTMIMHPIKPKLNGQSLAAFKDPAGKFLFVEMANKVRDSGEGVVPYLWPKPGFEEPVEKVSYVKGFKPWGWIIGSGIYIDDVDAIFWQQAQVLLGLALLLVAMLVGLSFVIARSILTPLNQTTDALENISQGDGDLTCQLPDDGKDEVTRLVKAFNTFAYKIKKTVIKVEEACHSLEGSSQELTSVAQRNNEQLNQQSLETQQVATAVTEMSATVHEIAGGAERAAASAKDADREAGNSMRVMANTTESIDSLASDIEGAASVINQLEQESQEIGAVLDVIRGIAEQTNLLALNAAIEAARAGEQGRGFAVVADEVRTLASRTQQSTEEINDMIERLQKGSQRAVQAMAQGNEKSRSTLEVVSEASTSVENIVAAINQISDMNMQIASAAEQQSAVAKEIDQSVVRIASLAEESSSAGDQVAASSENLSELGQQLNSLIANFKTH